MTEDHLKEILRRSREAEAAVEARRRALGPHPVALALRDIGLALEADDKYRHFLHPPTGRIILHAEASDAPDRTGFHRVEMRSWRPQMIAEEDQTAEMVASLLVMRGMRQLETPSPGMVSLRNLPGDGMSAHERLAIIAAVRADMARFAARAGSSA